jgi:chromosome segregation ATPase
MVTTTSLFSQENLDPRSLELLVQVIEDSNLPGFDYVELKRAVANLHAMNIEESVAYKSAFATATTVGVTKEKLIESAGYYRNLIAQEVDKFKQASEQQIKNKVTARQDEAKRLRDQVARHEADIARLQEEVARYRSEIESADAQAKTEQDKIARAGEQFDKTQAAVLLQIDRDVENMHKYL